MVDFISTQNELLANAAVLLGNTMEALEADSISKADLLSALHKLDALICLVSVSHDGRQLARDCRKAVMQ